MRDTVRISSLANASTEAKGWAEKVISLIDPQYDLPVFQVPHLVIRCKDTELKSDKLALTKTDIAKVFAFAGNTDKVLVHCHASQTRSPNTAIGILFSRGIPLKKAILSVLVMSPYMTVNRLIFDLIDSELKANGQFYTESMMILRELNVL